MKTSSFLGQLRRYSHLPAIFRAGGSGIAPHYHLTEVKRVRYETMDCGAQSHEWSETQLELWVPAAPDPARTHMLGSKLLQIIDRVERELPLTQDAVVRIHAAFRGQVPALHDVESIAVVDGALSIELAPDRTRCKAAERRAAELQRAGESDEPFATGATAGSTGCGCASSGSLHAVAACCA